MAENTLLKYGDNMELKIISEEEKPLLSRKEIKATLTFENATPSNKEVQELLAKQIKSDASLVLIKKIDSKYGLGKADVFAYQYKDADTLKNIEPQPKKKKGDDKKEGDAPAQETPAAAPAEKKEEKPAEAKKEEPKAADEKKAQ